MDFSAVSVIDLRAIIHVEFSAVSVIGLRAIIDSLLLCPGLP